MNWQVPEVKEVFKRLEEVKQLIIPEYHRNFLWKKAIWNTFFQDLLSLSKKNQCFFIGCIFLHFTKAWEKFVIIDGKQRVITLILLLKAIDFICKKKKIGIEIKSLSQELEKKIEFLKNDIDKTIFRKIMKDENGNNEEKKQMMWKCYSFFCDELKKLDKISIEKIYKSLCECEALFLTLMSTDEASKRISRHLFKRINTQQINLETVDFIRIYVLESDNKDIKNKWKQIEKEIGQNMTNFIKHYLCFKKKENVKSIYQSFKEIYEMNPEETIDEIRKFASYYQIIIKGTENNKHKEINKTLIVLRELEQFGQKTWYFCSYLFSVFEKWDLEKTNDILETIVNYCLRVTLMNKNKHFRTLFPKLSDEVEEEVKKWNKTSKSKYNEVLKAILLKKGAYSTDDEFRVNLQKIKIWKKHFALSVLKGIVIHNQKGKKYTEFNEIKKVQLEHIMPQQLNDQWKLDLGNDHEWINKNYKDALGNLTLAKQSWNSQASNNSFREKKEMYEKQFPELNQMIVDPLIINWDKDRIKERTEKLIDCILKAFPHLKSEYKFTTKRKKKENLNKSTLRRQNHKKNKESKEHGISNLLNNMSQKARDLTHEFETNIYLHDKKITRIINKRWISYILQGEYLYYVFPQKKRIKVFLNIKKKNMNWDDPHAMIKEGKSQWGNYYVFLNELNDINKAMNLIKQCYNYHK